MNYKFIVAIAATALLVCGCSTPVPQNMPVTSQPSTPIDVATHIDHPPVVIIHPNPIYPMDLRRARVSGEAQLQFVVTTEGDVVDAKVLSATDKRFGEAALEAVRQWKYKPATK